MQKFTFRKRSLIPKGRKIAVENRSKVSGRANVKAPNKEKYLKSAYNTALFFDGTHFNLPINNNFFDLKSVYGMSSA